MNTIKTFRYKFILLILAIASGSCLDTYTESFTANSPVYMSYEDLREAVKMNSSRELKNTGKIYFKDGYLFINEELKGIHVINNQDPTSPQNIGFIEIPGNVDIAIKNDILYADSFVDLVAIDISTISNPVEAARLEDVFPYTVPPLEDEEYPAARVDEEKGVVIEWEIKRIEQEMEYHYTPIYYRLGITNEFSMMDAAAPTSSASGGSFGIGGSMARFGLYNDYLYVVDNSNLYMFDVTDGASPMDIGNQNVGWQIETMFIYDDHMFFGTQNGMRIFSLDVPTVPKYVGDFWHVTSCDPVVVDDGYAYVTLRGGTRCGSNVNRLDVLKLSSNYTNNELLASYPMHGPYGLGIDGQTLFVCDGDAGLKVYDVENKFTIDDHMIARFSNINAYDVIPFEKNLFMIGEDGFYQYDYSDINDITQISFIPVKKEDK